MSSVSIIISPIECGHDEIEAVIETICRLGQHYPEAKRKDMVTTTTIVQGRHLVLEPCGHPDNRRKFLDDIGPAEVEGFTIVGNKIVWSEKAM